MITPERLTEYLKPADDHSGDYVKVRYNFVLGKKKGKVSTETKFPQRRIKIGKCQYSHIRIPDFLAATLHGEIRKQREWVYEDFSIAGTQVNKRNINGETVLLNEGDVLRIGDFEIELLGYSR